MTDLQALHDTTHTMVMGVLNITEDSSSDGGLWLDPAKAAQHGRDMMAAGADIIDIGAESTRPGAKRVSEADELARITGAVKTLIPAGAILSIDTTRASVAAAALSEGAQIINDVSGGTLDAELPHVVADHDCLYIVLARRLQGREPRSRHLRIRARCIDRRTRRTHAPSRRRAGRRRKA